MSPATPAIGVAGGVDGPEHAHSLGEGVLLQEIAQLSLGDEKPVGVNTEASGAYSGKATTGDGGYSPDPKQIYTPPFVRNGRSKSDDPFQSSPKKSTSVLVTPKSQRIMSDWRSGSSNSGGSGSESPLMAKSQRKDQKFSLETQKQIGGSPSGKVVGYALVKAEDAQAHYPPSCCVFVANLLQSESEEVLQMAVTQIFREFGPVYVKIRRDAKHMPFAFCQYTQADHADRAIAEGRGRYIKGRPCRCEKAKAHRLFFIERKYGPIITPDEAEKLLQRYGKIELCYVAPLTERTVLNLNEGVIVQFELYDDGQTAFSAFRNHDIYKMTPIAGLGSPPRANQIPHEPSSDSSINARAYLARYEVDRRSIFIGNLPSGTTEIQVHGLFEYYGVIVDITVRDALSKFDVCDKLAFAFVEFREVGAVSKAIAAKNGFTFAGRAIKVAQKDSDSKTPNVRSRSMPIASAASYNDQSPVSAARTTPQASPMAHVPAPVYGSPYGYPYSPAYSHGQPAYVADGQSYYPTAPYSPTYYYGGSPSYDPRAAATTDASGTAPAHPSYYGYPAYYPYYAPAPYWPSNNAEQTAAQVTYYPPAYSPPEAGGGTEDRSATPTPVGHTSVTEAPVETQ